MSLEGRFAFACVGGWPPGLLGRSASVSVHFLASVLCTMWGVWIQCGHGEVRFLRAAGPRMALDRWQLPGSALGWLEFF